MSAEDEDASPREDPAPAIWHPLYVDADMLSGFVASIEGGVALESQVREVLTSATSAERKRRAAGGLSFSSILPVKAEGGKESAEKESAEQVEERTATREHNAASLLALLRLTLLETGVVRLPVDGVRDPALSVGDLVEIGGRFLGSPLQDALRIARRIIPFIALADMGLFDLFGSSDETTAAPSTAVTWTQQTQQQQQARDRKRQRRAPGQASVEAKDEEVESALSPAIQAASILVDALADDIDDSVTDALVELEHGGGRVVVTMARAHLSDTNEQMLRDTDVRVIGKVTAIFRDSEFNFLRRSVLGLGGSDLAREISSGFDSSPVPFSLPSLVMAAPVLQIAPLAVLV